MIKIKKGVLKIFNTPFCDRGGLRTPNPQSRNLIFYPVELRGPTSYKLC